MSDQIEPYEIAAFAVFDKGTGRVLSSGVCQHGMQCDQVTNPETEDVIYLHEPVDPNAYAVVNGVLVRKS